MNKNSAYFLQIRLAHILHAGLITLASITPVFAQTDLLIEVDRGRVADKSPVFQRAILSKPASPTTTALLYFRGNPGIARIRSVADKSPNLTPFIRANEQLFLDEKIALVVMDCPTDRWNGCPESYRISAAHADDVRSIIRVLKTEHGLSDIYIMGHSMGGASSRGLARSLGNEIAGSIHSSVMNVAPRRGGGDFGIHFSGFPYTQLPAPQLHVHNKNDSCPSTPYWPVKEYAGKNLVTVLGGSAEGDPCGGGNLHSHQGRETLVIKSIIEWIKTKKVDPFIGE